MKKHQALIIICVIVFSFENCHASAWTKNKGAGEFINTLRYHNYNERHSYELNPYFEYGTLDWLTLGGNLGLRLEDKDSSKKSSVSFAELFSRFRLAEGRAGVLSLQATLGSGARGLSTPFLNTSEMGELRASWGVSSGARSFGSLYFNFETAFRSYYEALGSEWRSDLSVGWKFYPKWIFLSKYFIVNNLKSRLGTYDYEAQQFQSGFVFPVYQSWQGEVFVAKALSGTNVDFEPTYGLSLWYSWK